MKVFNICDSPMAFFFQRQSQEVNNYFNEKLWRYYYDFITVPGAQHFLDLSQMNTRDEVFHELEKADCFLFHATRNYLRPLYCRDGIIKSKDYPLNNKMIIILIHGQPETKEIIRTNDFIQRQKRKVKFLVSTPNQLHLFNDTELFPAVGILNSKNEMYTPRKNFLDFVESESVKIIRRSEWKATMFAEYILNLMNAKDWKPRGKQHLVYFLKENLGIKKKNFPQLIFNNNNKYNIVFDNRVYWQDIFDILKELKNSDILLENDLTDYPGGGCNCIIGMEALSQGVVTCNALLKMNSEIFANWLEADSLPPYANWVSREQYFKNYKKYLKTIILDRDLRNNLKKRSVEYFLKWMDAPVIVPKLIKKLEKLSS